MKRKAIIIISQNMTLIQAAAMAAVAHLKIDYYIDTPLPLPALHRLVDNGEMSFLKEDFHE